MPQWTLKSEDETEFIREIQHLSDRLVGLLAPIVIDNRITEAVQSRLSDGPIRGGSTILTDLFSSHGEIGSFGTRIRLAYAMGIFSPETFSDLTRIEKVRNEFAHRLNIKSFDDQPVVDFVREIKINLRHPKKEDEPHIFVMGDHEDGWQHFFDSTNRLDDTKPREKFLRAIQIIAHELYLLMNYKPGLKGPI